jgi:hypothetical protein
MGIFFWEERVEIMAAGVWCVVRGKVTTMTRFMPRVLFCVYN